MRSLFHSLSLSFLHWRCRHHESGRDTWCHRRKRAGTTSNERSNGNNKQTNQCGHIAVSQLQSHPFSPFSSLYTLSLFFSSSSPLLFSCFSLYSFAAARERGIWAVRNARRRAFGVQGKMVSASARSGISGSDRVAQRGFLWVMHEVSPILLGPVPLSRPAPPLLGPPAQPGGPASPSTFHPLPLSSYAAEACIVQADTLRSRAVPVPFTERGLMDSL